MRKIIQEDNVKKTNVVGDVGALDGFVHEGLPVESKSELRTE